MPPKKIFTEQLIFMTTQEQREQVDRLASLRTTYLSYLMRDIIRSLIAHVEGVDLDTLRKEVERSQPEGTYNFKVNFGTTKEQDQFIRDLGKDVGIMDKEDDEGYYAPVLRYAVDRYIAQLPKSERVLLEKPLNH